MMFGNFFTISRKWLHNHFHPYVENKSRETV